MTSAYVCPFCGGRGEVRKGTYDDRANYSVLNWEHEQCQMCDGNGYIVIVVETETKPRHQGPAIDVYPV